MAGITKEQAEAKLAAYLEAETRVLAGQKVEIDGVVFTRADLGAIQKGVQLWNSRAIALSGKGLRVREVIPR